MRPYLITVKLMWPLIKKSALSLGISSTLTASSLCLRKPHLRHPLICFLVVLEPYNLNFFHCRHTDVTDWASFSQTSEPLCSLSMERQMHILYIASLAPSGLSAAGRCYFTPEILRNCYFKITHFWDLNWKQNKYFKLSEHVEFAFSSYRDTYINHLCSYCAGICHEDELSRIWHQSKVAQTDCWTNQSVCDLILSEKR